MSAPGAFRPFLEHPERAGVFTDFDGTLAPIVDDPAAARPVDGAADVLQGLVGRYARAGVISGRPVAFLRRFVGVPGLLLSGEYGLEQAQGEEVIADDEARKWRDAVEDAAARAESAGVAERVERNGLSFALHFRAEPPRRTAVEA